MKKIFVVSILAVASVLLSSCAGGTTMDAPGFLYADRTLGYDANGALGSKEGKACAESILGLVATGDGSIRAAAKEGGIKNVSSVSRYVKNYLGVYAQVCTVVTGS